MSSNTTTVNTILAAPNQAAAVFLSLTHLFGVVGNILGIYSNVNQRSLLKNNYYFLVLHQVFCYLLALLLTSYDAYEAWCPNCFFTRSLAMCKVWQPTLTVFRTRGCLQWCYNCNLSLLYCFTSLGFLVCSDLQNLGVLVSLSYIFK